MALKSAAAAGLALCWLGSIAAAANMFWNYEGTPGASLPAPGRFPVQAAVADKLRLARHRDTILLFLHPHCPCSRATLHELRRIHEDIHRKAAVTILFVKPPGARRGWCHTFLWRRAKKFRWATVGRDANGRLARIFNARTSGQLCLYARNGRLLFSGGITGARGHRGPNAGMASVVRLVNSNPGHASRRASSHAPVFGCSLFGNVLPNGAPALCHR